MDKIVTSCFSVRNVGPDLDKRVNELKKAFASTGVSTTLKIHVILTHLNHRLLFLDQTGLDLWSEQADELIHREFLIYSRRYEMNSIDDPSYITRLKAAVVEFSSQHL